MMYNSDKITNFNVVYVKLSRKLINASNFENNTFHQFYIWNKRCPLHKHCSPYKYCLADKRF